MSPRRLWAVARKETLQVARDPRSLVLSLAIPALLLLLFGTALELDVEDVPLAVCDEDRTAQSRAFVSLFEGSPTFRVRSRARSRDEAEAAIDRGEVLAALVLPPGFGRSELRGRPAQAQLVVDGSDATTATVAIGYARVLASLHGREPDVRRRAAAADLRPRAWFNAALASRNFIVPGLIAVIMMVIAALLTSLTLSREWERGTLEQLLTTPVKGPELVVGKLAPYFAVGMLDVVAAVALGEFLFGVPLRGSGALVFLASAVFLVGALSMGVLISMATRSQLLSNQLAMLLTFLPAFLLSGFVFPVHNMPLVVRLATYAVPARYFIGLQRAVYLKGLGPADLAAPLGFLALFAAAMLGACALGFRKRIA